MFRKPDPADLKPCRHMQTLVSAWVDGKLTGLARWYTQWHVQDCPQCQSSLPFLRTLHFRLSALETQAEPQTLSEARWQSVEAAWAHAEAGTMTQESTEPGS